MLVLTQRPFPSISQLEVRVDGVFMIIRESTRLASDRRQCHSAQVGSELKPGLIDFGQCTTLTKNQLRTVCQLVVLLRTRSQTLIDQALRGSGFGFNTEDPELKLALLC